MVRNLRLKLNKEELCRLYLEEKRSLEDIARIYGVTRVAVWKYCKAVGLTRRRKSEARLEAQKKGKVPQNYFHINDQFFSEWSSEMAYVLGLLMTDGCLSRVKNGSYKISLCLNDKGLLGKVARVMESDHHITLSRHQEGLYLFIFGREKMIQDLIKLGMKPRKSMDLKFPDVPEKYLRDFIRGVFDGDGSVFFGKRSPKFRLRSSFVSGSKNFIEAIENKLGVLGMPKRNIYQKKTKNGILYMIRYYHNNSLKLFKILYKNSQNGLFLERKYNKFLVGFRGNLERKGNLL